MKRQTTFVKTLVAVVLASAAVVATINFAPAAFASGGSAGGGGGTVQAPSFSGNWTGAISTPFGTGSFTIRISQSQTTLTGSAHFGAPIFDATLKLNATSTSGSLFSGLVTGGEGSLPITGTLSPDATRISGTVVQLNKTYTYVVTRN